MNKEWHRLNKMPRYATDAVRLAWRREHQKHCACRPIPKRLADSTPSLVKNRPGKKTRPAEQA